MHGTLGNSLSCFFYSYFSCANHQLKKLDKAKTDFVSRASHDLRGPIGGINNYASTLEEGLFGEVNDQQKEALGKIMTIDRNMLHLVEDLLDASKIDSGGMGYDFQKCHMEKICQDIYDVLEPRIPGYKYDDGGWPTLTLDGMKEKGLLS